MTAIAHDGNVFWYFAPTVVTLASPKVTEITGAIRLAGITNYDTPSSEAEVDTSGVDDIYDTSVVGTSKAGPIVLTMKRDDTSEVNGWDALTFRAVGFLIKSKKGAAILGSKVEVYPVQIGQKRPEGYSKNTTQKFMTSFYVTSAPQLNATVVT